MTDSKIMLDGLRDSLAKLERHLGKEHKSLATFPRGATRLRYAEELLKSFDGVESEQFKQLISEWMYGDQPDMYSVQSFLTALIVTENTSFVETVLTCIDERSSRSKKEAWWGEACLHRFEELLQGKVRLQRLVRLILQNLRKKTEALAR